MADVSFPTPAGDFPHDVGWTAVDPFPDLRPTEWRRQFIGGPAEGGPAILIRSRSIRAADWLEIFLV